MTKLPTPSDMLEELADKVLAHMDRMAVTSFDIALEEMLDYHRFLIDAYGTTDQAGNIISFAEIGGWRALHQEWIRQYHRLAERATGYIGRQDDFLEKLLGVPNRLMPQDHQKASLAVTTGLLDLALIYVHRLEEWVTRRRSDHQVDAQTGAMSWNLAGSDKRSYEEILNTFAGRWEDMLQYVDIRYQWHRRGVMPDEQWRRYAASWPFIHRHLRNTAYLLAVAVWNEDETGADVYCDILLRWLEAFQHKLNHEYVSSPRLLTPDIMSKPWEEVHSAFDTESRRFGTISPAGVFDDVIRAATGDVIVIAAGVMLAWFVEKRQATDISVRFAKRLLLNEISSDEELRSIARVPTFRSLLFDLIRLKAIGERFQNSSYGGWLDELVRFMDSMTERRVVPGRVYTPSTKNERDDLAVASLVALLALLPAQGDDAALQKLLEFTADEAAFPHTDQTLRNLAGEIERLQSFLTQENNEFLRAGLRAFSPDADFPERQARLQALLAAAINGIDEQRNARLRARPVAPEKLEKLRKAIEDSLLDGNGGLEIFSGFEIKTTADQAASASFTIRDVEKAYFVDPSMANEPINFWEHLVQLVQNHMSDLTWRDFSKLQRTKVDTPNSAAFQTALLSASVGIHAAGRQPILLVRSWDDPPWIREWTSSMSTRPPGLTFERKADIKTGSYVGTLSGIDIYRAVNKDGEALMFPAEILTKVTYGLDKNQAITVEYIADANSKKGHVVVHFKRATIWSSDAVVVLDYGRPA
ncbi:MAG: hypothetical protein SFV19_17790 [Rhodospirillaceae bacterium]|nr:hypothetical protein [Rhodospirillaceae bacterium]